MFNKLTVRSVLTLAACFSALTGCAADGAEDQVAGDDALETDGIEIGETSSAVINAWTPWTSEEHPPISCSGSAIFKAAQCRGPRCDDTRAYCNATWGTRGSSWWTSYFSEEGTNWRFCGANEWITGLACQGAYCDNVSLQCTAFTGITPNGCFWTGWHSEENGGFLDFGAEYYARGMQCNGASCDNKRWYVCRL